MNPAFVGFFFLKELFSSNGKVLSDFYQKQAAELEITLSSSADINLSRTEIVNFIVEEHELNSEQEENYEIALLAQERLDIFVNRANSLWHIAWFLVIPLVIVIPIFVEKVNYNLAEGRIVGVVLFSLLPFLFLWTWNLLIAVVQFPIHQFFLMITRQIGFWMFQPKLDRMSEINSSPE